MEERRDYVRVATPVNIAYTKCHSSEKEKLSFSKDISRRGVCLIIEEELRKSDLLDLKIYLSEEETRIIIRGRVIWINKFTTNGVSRKKRLFYVGIQFTKVKEEDANRIDKHISSAL